VSSLRKSVIKIPNTGAVEFLCNGNFIVMAGMHTKSGERYHWVDESSKIPSMTEQEFVTLCTKIAESFGLEWAPSRRGADAVEVSAEDMDPSDPVVAFVRDFHLKPGGRVLPHIMDIVCPFADTHTSYRRHIRYQSREHGERQSHTSSVCTPTAPTAVRLSS